MMISVYCRVSMIVLALQYYMYELLDGGNATARSPSHACPFAIVSFSYGDTKATTVEPQEKRYGKNIVQKC